MDAGAVEVIVVPFDVERRDTPSARGAGELVERGLLDGIGERGWAAHVTGIPSCLPPQGDVGAKGRPQGSVDLAKGRADRADPGGGKAEIVADVCLGVARAVALARSRGRFPLVLSGGCLVAVGVVAGLQRGGREPRIVWVDAHGDFNTPASTLSGYWDGMALAAVCGRCLPEVCAPVGLRPVRVRDVVHLAGRDFDPTEREDFERLELCVIPPAAVGSEECRRALAARPRERRDLYLHVDLDGLDPRDAPAVSYPCPGGPPLAALLASFAALEVPVAMTLSTASFDHAGAAPAERTLATCRQLIDAFLGRDPGTLPSAARAPRG